MSTVHSNSSLPEVDSSIIEVDKDTPRASVEIAVGPTWPGFSKIKHLIIFGDSYSAVGYTSRHARPSREEPLGVVFPGTTYCEAAETEHITPSKWGHWASKLKPEKPTSWAPVPKTPNWVGHLITNYDTNTELRVYDYAVGGSTVHGLNTQIERDFLPSVGPKPSWASWTENDSLFVNWFGINDCAFVSDPTENIQILIEKQAQLYRVVGARNFLFIGVPPMHRSPAYQRLKNQRVAVTREDPSSRFITWNEALHEAATNFAAAHPDATVIYYSSYDTFSRMLDDPVGHGFPEADVQRSSGAVWMDHLHPTSAVHNFVARDVSFLLNSVAVEEQVGISVE